ncbi:hypothetical protein Phum_PHUM537450 [Pediculus humanus corporis]|uniref:Large proline-rich protein BAG6 n=1 Tax=Pediculus humanus subsp. corporis TaxID=121224 RepID=E0VZR7_PEDHC|nr:uncharacterized protein Phum_PHUM537450 [Pediculus humanus corporis]EEB18873.1 hypothetical protein Phum_PHUM537450 [Pediculus humanus corporis]
MLELTVKTLDSQNHSFTVPDETTILQLKESILEKMGVPVEIQRLIFHGKVLQDEKKLSDYGDVNGKVIHLVQRPPPPPSRGNANNSSEGNQRTNNRRAHYSNRDRIDGSSSTYLGTMAFPTDFIEPQGMIQLPPSQRLSRRRLLVAQRMLNQAGACITALENNESQPSNVTESQETSTSVNFISSNTSNNVVTSTFWAIMLLLLAGREEADMFLGETTGSIARAAQAATAAAIAAAVSAAHSVVPHITVRGASGQNDSPNSNLDNTNSNMSDLNLNLNINENHPEDVAVEVEIGANSDVSVDECHDGDSIANNLDNNPSGNNTAPPRLSVERTSSFATLIEQLEEQQRRFQGVLRRCHQLMSSPTAEECQRLFNGVSETMHHFAHAYHALSDIMVDFNEDTPRTLRCRPVIIQHSAILETVFPIQVLEAQINLSTRRNTVDGNSNLTNSGTNQQPSANVNTTTNNANTNGNSNVNANVNGNTIGNASVNANVNMNPNTNGANLPAHNENSNSENLPNSQPPETFQENGMENMTPQESASSFTSTTTQQSEERSQSSQIGGINNTSGFFLSGPGNLEVFMDFRPESVTLGSVETTVFLDNEGRERNNSGSGIQLRNIGTGRSPMELLHSVQAVAGQIQNQLMNRINQNSPQTDNPPPYEGVVQQSSSASGMSNQSAPSRAQSSASTESNTTTQNASNSRPHVHVGRAIPDVALNSYDPFLPCNSHHIRSQNRNSNRNANSQTTNRNAAENERPTVIAERDSFMAMMSQFLNPQRVNVSRVQPRQSNGTSNGSSPAPNANGTSPRNVPRRQNTQTGQPESTNEEPPRSFTWTPLPNNITGWSLSASPASPGTRRNITDYFRVSSGRDVFSIFNQFAPGTTIAEFLSTVYHTSYNEGESIVSDFLMTLARNLSWPDLLDLSVAQRSMVESIVTRLHPTLHTFVLQRLLQGETPSAENIARACERLYTELRPYIDVMQVARLKESVDLAATINNFNQSQIPEIVGLIVDPYLSQSPNFGQTMTQRVRNYVRQLLAIIIYCCQDGVQGFDAIVQSCVRLLTQGVPEDLQQWTETNSVNNLRYYTSTLNVPFEDIQRYLVYRIPNSTIEKRESSENNSEPMETDTIQNRTVWIQPENVPSPEKVDEPIAESLVDIDGDGLPDVLIGSESWHNALPSEWVPIIARDTQRQRRQSSQKPFSDAYLSSLPPKRRKLIASSKTQGNISQVISDGVRNAITAAGVSSNVAEKAIAEAGKDDVLQEAYKEQERVVVEVE